MKITIGSDHGAVELKEEIKKVLADFADIEVKDLGTFGDTAVDYPDIAEKVCQTIINVRRSVEFYFVERALVFQLLRIK